MLTPPASPKEEVNFNETETKVLNFPDANPRTDCDEHDETLEVLMTDLDEENAKQFYLENATVVAEKRHRNSEKDDGTDHLDVFSNTSDMDEETVGTLPAELTTEGHALGTVVSESCGLSDVYPKSKFPDARIDAYLFTPCGFSANGVVPAPDGNAPTLSLIHISEPTRRTPISYAVFCLKKKSMPSSA